MAFDILDGGDSSGATSRFADGEDGISGDWYSSPVLPSPAADVAPPKQTVTVPQIPGMGGGGSKSSHGKGSRSSTSSAAAAAPVATSASFSRSYGGASPLANASAGAAPVAAAPPLLPVKAAPEVLVSSSAHMSWGTPARDQVAASVPRPAPPSVPSPSDVVLPSHSTDAGPGEFHSAAPRARSGKRQIHQAVRQSLAPRAALDAEALDRFEVDISDVNPTFVALLKPFSDLAVQLHSMAQSIFAKLHGGNVMNAPDEYARAVDAFLTMSRDQIEAGLKQVQRRIEKETQALDAATAKISEVDQRIQRARRQAGEAALDRVRAVLPPARGGTLLPELHVRDVQSIFCFPPGSRLRTDHLVQVIDRLPSDVALVDETLSPFMGWFTSPLELVARNEAQSEDPFASPEDLDSANFATQAIIARHGGRLRSLSSGLLSEGASFVDGGSDTVDDI